MSKDSALLFVYGSLRRHYEHPMAHLLGENARHLGAASAPGALYLVSWYPGLVTGTGAETGRQKVKGDLFALDYASSPDLLAQLDAYEGEEYERLRIEATLDSSGETHWAWAYALAGGASGHRRIPSGDFFDQSVDGDEPS